MTDEERLTNTLLSDQTSLQSPLEKDVSATVTSASHHSKYPDGLPGEYSAKHLLIATSDAQRWIATGVTPASEEVKQEVVSEYAKCAKENWKDDREYTIDHIVLHVGKRAKYVLYWKMVWQLWSRWNHGAKHQNTDAFHGTILEREKAQTRPMKRQI